MKIRSGPVLETMKATAKPWNTVLNSNKKMAVHKIWGQLHKKDSKAVINHISFFASRKSYCSIRVNKIQYNKRANKIK